MNNRELNNDDIEPIAIAEEVADEIADSDVDPQIKQEVEDMFQAVDEFMQQVDIEKQKNPNFPNVEPRPEFDASGRVSFRFFVEAFNALGEPTESFTFPDEELSEEEVSAGMSP